MSNRQAFENAKKKFRQYAPAVQAVTYDTIEIPYHHPPILYKICILKDKVQLFERKNNWNLSSPYYLNNNSIDSVDTNDYNNLRNLQQFSVDFAISNIKKSPTPFNNNNSNDNRNNNDVMTSENDKSFLSFYLTKGYFPETKWKLIENYEEHLQNLFTKNDILLKKDHNYMWVIDENFNFIFAPEYQEDFALNRNRVKHGDLTATGKVLIGSLDNVTMGRLPARMGGEFRYTDKNNCWRIDNDSSYCFFREDNLIISNTNHVKWQSHVDLLLRGFGINTTEIIWLDLVQSRKLDSFIVQRISKQYVRLKRTSEKEQALKKISNTNLVNLFKGVNVMDVLFGAFGINCYLLTTGKLIVNIIEANNLPKIDLLNLQHAYSFCCLQLKGCEMLEENKYWWERSYQTKKIDRDQNPKFNEQFKLYVSSLDSQVLDMKIYHNKHGLMDILIGECQLELDGLPENEEVMVVIPLTTKQRALGFFRGNRQQQDDSSPTSFVAPVYTAHNSNYYTIKKPLSSNINYKSTTTNEIIPTLKLSVKYVPHLVHRNLREDNEREVSL
ncbi:hypothetical protein ABK040_005397 [Willaertia magna]